MNRIKIASFVLLALLLVTAFSTDLEARHHGRRGGVSFGFGFGGGPVATPVYVAPVVAPAPVYVDPYGAVYYPAPAPAPYYVYPARPAVSWYTSFWR